jgi:2-polyprenyl-3-methyl-5-hydroxy-6-metoxy-1,4-benzoquinol methylase
MQSRQSSVCHLCGSNRYKIIYDIKGAPAAQQVHTYKITNGRNDLLPLRVVRCVRCGLVYAIPGDNTQHINLQYANLQDDVYVAEEQGRRITARIILKKIAKYKRKGKLLEIGPATGFLLDEAQKQGWETYGVELSKWAVDFARRKFHLTVFNGVLKDAGFPCNYFDVIVMADLIEHLPDPRETLKEARNILKPTGILFITTPDIDSFLSKLFKARWWGIQQAHIYYFSRRTLSKLLDAAGFTVVKYTSHVRVFSIRYWKSRIKELNNSMFKLIDPFTKGLSSQNSLLKVSFQDQLAVFVRKKHSLEFIGRDENQDAGESIKRKLKTIVVLPAYNAAKTLETTVKDIPKNLVDEIIVVDDASRDNTAEIAGKLGLKTFVHPKNKGYGANQKTCYTKALEMGADIVVMVHPDYQYDPMVISELITPIQKGQADAVFGSRMMKGGALEGGMPLWKHNVNILLTALENVILGTFLTEYHSGFRAYSSRYLKAVNFMANSDDFVFDNEMIVQGMLHYLKIEEVPIRTRYFDEASTIKFLPAGVYGLKIVKTLFKYLLHKHNIVVFKQFS